MKITCVYCHKIFEYGKTGYCPHCYNHNKAPEPPAAMLVMTTEDGKTHKYPLGAYSTLGRHPENTIQIMDKMISKKHLSITFRSGTYFLEDLKSRNGTFINNRRIKEKVLEPGDEIQLGTIRLTFSYKSEAANKKLTQQVNIVADKKSSPISQQVRPQVADRDFLPENEIQDNETIRRDYEKLRTAHLLNRKIGLELELDKLLDQILEETFKIVPADRGVILLMDESQTLQPQCVKERRSRREPKEIGISRVILETVVKERAGVISSDAKIDERFNTSQSIIMQGIRSAMCVPLIARAGGDILGAMHLDTQSAIGVFVEKDLQLLSVIASQAAIAIENAQLAKKIEEETVIRAYLQRFLSPSVMDRLNKDHLTIRMGGELKEATVMFTDIRGFTSISERYDPEALVLELNKYFELLVDEIFAREGTLDKFIGDAIMAVWGTPQQNPKDPINAVMAAFDIQEQLADFNETLISLGKPPFHTGIGIDTGDVVAGNMGSPKRLEFTVIGDHVNIAARLCGEAKAGEVIISESTFRRVEKYFTCTALPPTEVKGKAEPLRIYRVESKRNVE